MNPQQMNGLELMQALAAGHLPMPNMAKTMPMTMESAEPNRVVFAVTADERHANPMGGVHGGFAATVLDSVTACATHTILPAGVSYGTIELNVKMCKAIPFNRTLRAEGKVVNASSRLVISEGNIRDEAGTLYAYGTATCMILR
ncbi:PaaI family thioesterase [Pseudomonas sp. MBLB4136]|uniref:PaaI family thioesterase n=1 Tax=Pseudomonas sp. MBLB4136 TaxID=3451558 RepID=UPI003F75399A